MAIHTECRASCNQSARACDHIGEHNAARPGSASEHTSARTKRQAPVAAGRLGDRGGPPALVRIPDDDGIIAANGRKRPAVGMKSDRANRFGVAPQDKPLTQCR